MVVADVANDDCCRGGPAAEQLIWVDTAAAALAGWRSGDWVLVESAASPPLRQVARVEGVAVAERPQVGASGAAAASAVRISRLLALTLGARSGSALRVSVAPVHHAESSPARAATSVHFATSIDLREKPGAASAGLAELAAAAKATQRGSSHKALYAAGMSDFLGMMLKGSVVIPGQAISIEWLNRPQLAVVVSASCGSGEGAVTATVIDDSTLVTFQQADRDGIDGGIFGAVRAPGIEAWLELPPPPVPPTVQGWEAQVVRQVGGMGVQVRRLLHWMHAVLSASRDPNKQSELGHCIFVHGVSGCGKTHLVETALQCAPGVTVCRLDGGQVLQPTLEDSIATVAAVFRAARRQQPSVVLIEELDALGGAAGAAALSLKGSSGGLVGLVQARVIARLNYELDRLANGPGHASVAVVATSSRPDVVATALRRAGRFEVEMEIPSASLSPLQRQEVLRVLTSQFNIGEEHQERGDLVARVAELAVGYVAADLSNLIREAALRAMAKAKELKAADDDTSQGKLVVTWDHFEAALAVTRPASLQRLRRGGDKGGAGAGVGETQSLQSFAQTVDAEAVRQLKASILLPLSTNGRAVFESAGLRPSCGALLYGPAGNGKTMLAGAIGRSCTAGSNFNFIEVHAAELLSAVSGESEKNVSALFVQARSAAPSVLFIDEIDTLAPIRGGGGASSSLNTLERVLSIFLTQLDGIGDTGVSAPVVIIGATRDISAVDSAILRSGRIDTHIYIGNPGAAAREAIIRLRCSKMAQTSFSADQIGRLVANTSGFSRAEIDSLCRESVMRALREDIGATQVREDHFMVTDQKGGPSAAAEVARLERVIRSAV